MSERICAVAECEQPTVTRGWCETHYRAWLHYGDPTIRRRPAIANVTCSVPGCPTVEQTRRGMCGMHYLRWKHDGDPGQVDPLLIFGDDLARFWSHVDKDGPVPVWRPDLGQCWLWTGYRNKWGYGKVMVARHSTGAHRFSYTLLVGPIPDGLQTDHLCRVTSCVRPTHLEPVTQSENVRRRNLARSAERGRQSQDSPAH